MRKFSVVALLALGAVAGCGRARPSEGWQVSNMSEIVIQHEGRNKPIETWAREIMHGITGKEKFTRFKYQGDPEAFKDLRDPDKEQVVVVFPSTNATETILRIMAQPEEYAKRPYLKIQYPEIKEQFKLDPDRDFYSPEELAKVGVEMQEEITRIRAMEEKEWGLYDRATLQVAEKIQLVQLLSDDAMLQVIPLPYGLNNRGKLTNRWPSLMYLAGYLETPVDQLKEITDPSAKSLVDALAKVERAKLEKTLDLWDDVKEHLAAGKAEEFNRASAELRDLLRGMNDEAYPSKEKVEKEIGYNNLRPFSVAALGYGFAVFFFLLAFVFRSNAMRWLGVGFHLVGIGTQVLGYFQRWEIAQRYPLANMYESMIAMGLFLGIIGIIFEMIYRSRVFGMCAAVISTLCVVGAEHIPIFTPFISQQQPALLNQIIMTIHVPTIMSAYGTGFLCTGIGFAYILVYLFRPGNTKALEHLDLCLYRILQVTVLLLIGGIGLGMVWAGEAWGRPWGWDMKEVWALITLVWYLVMLHSRLTNRVKGLWLAQASLVGFAIIMLTYVGVNILFGKGLHTYGFVLGATWYPLLAIFAVEALLIVVSTIAFFSRKRDGQAAIPESPAE